VTPPRTTAGRRLTIYVAAHDHVGHHALVGELMTRARHLPVAGATVFRGTKGYGESERLHQAHLVGDDAPVRMVVVDTPEQIDRFRAAIDDLVGSATVVVDDVEIVDP
jgi:PII-like signaling protein